MSRHFISLVPVHVPAPRHCNPPSPNSRSRYFYLLQSSASCFVSTLSLQLNSSIFLAQSLRVTFFNYSSISVSYTSVPNDSLSPPRPVPVSTGRLSDLNNSMRQHALGVSYPRAAMTDRYTRGVSLTGNDDPVLLERFVPLLRITSRRASPLRFSLAGKKKDMDGKSRIILNGDRVTTDGYRFDFRGGLSSHSPCFR